MTDRPMRRVATGLGMLESPRWHEGRLWFADWTAGRIHAVAEDGRLETVVEHRSLPLCFDFLPDGFPLLASAPRLALLRVTEDGKLEPYADLSGVSSEPANEVVCDARGTAYVNFVNLELGRDLPPDGPAPGFVVAVGRDGVPRVVADDLAFPNGMALSADGSTLVVAESYRSRLVAFTVEDDGALSGRRVFAELGGDAPDGICLDNDGNAWYADVPHQHAIRVAEGGEVLDRVDVGQGAFSCVLDGPGTTLFVVTATWPGVAGLATHTAWNGTVVAVDVTV